MEKITFEPLVLMLRQKREACNRLFSTYSIRHPSLDPDLVKRWMVRAVEPVMREFHTADAETFESLFDVLYETLLRLAGAHRLQSEAEAHRRALMLIPLVKERARESPEQLVHSMFTALNAILPHGPDAALAWISRMRKALPHCDAMADVLNAGRLCAWRSGLAHLRERALAAARELPPEAASGALNTPVNAGLLQRMEENPWFSPGKTESADAGSGGLVFRCRMGGFRGFGGPFLKPPAVARVEQCFVASDGESGCAVFA
ncbi:MAG: hypothetical protein GY859_06995, partial [Desulfobacterales bacterium]|nr:hypothetical protein [Desulfobacterales bacterium]